MGDSGKRVVVTGLRDLGSALKAADAEASKELGQMMKGIAQGVVADVSHRVPYRSGKAASSYKARGSARGASIAWAGERAPYVPWLDFGGKVGRHKTVSRPFKQGGRFLYPTIADNMHDVEELVAQAIDEITGKYGFKVEGV